MSITSYVLKVRENGSTRFLFEHINTVSIYTGMSKNMYKIYMTRLGNYKTGMKNNLYTV